MNRLRATGLAGLLMVAVAACSSSSAGSATPTPSPTPSPSPTPAASAAASASGLFPFPSLGNSDAALEALIPDSIGAITLQKYSMKANEFLGSSSSDPQTSAFLSALGVSPADISVAFGFGVDTANQSALAIFAFKAPGAGSDKLMSVFQSAASQGDTKYSWQSATIGGKSVQVADEPSQPGLKIYLYATNDVLFLVSGNPTPAADALSKLP